MKKRKRARKKSASSLIPRIEQAVCLLRNLPAKVWAGWMLGAFPFAVLWVGFSAMLWESARAREQLAGGALIVTLSFLWLKYRQARFAEGLYSVLSPNGASRREPMAQLWKRILLQEPLGLYLLMVSRGIGLSHPFLVSYYQSLSVGGGLGREGESPVTRARGFARSDPRGASMYVLLAAPGLSLLVFLNWAMVIALLPRLAFSLTGIENAFIRSPWNYLHISVWMTVLMLTWLTMDPLHKAFFLLRGYYTSSATTGLDLRDRVRGLARASVWILCLAGALFSAPSLQAAVDPDALDQTVREVSQQRRFLWRVPPEVVPSEDRDIPGPLRAFGDALGWLWDQGVNLWEWFRDLFPDTDPKRQIEMQPGSISGLAELARMLMIILAAGLVILILVLLIRAVVNNRNARKGIDRLEKEDGVDLEDEKVIATDLPADEWLALVDELERKGQWRLALRALFLAFLARLADQGVVSVARATSNREYEEAISRRAHAFPGVLEVFSPLRRHLEEVWYGDRPIGPDLLREQRLRVQSVEAGV